jgi:hypothetical protein
VVWVAFAPEPSDATEETMLIVFRGEDANIYAWLYSGIQFLFLYYLLMWMIYMKVKKSLVQQRRWSVDGCSIVSGDSNINVDHLPPN